MPFLSQMGNWYDIKDGKKIEFCKGNSLGSDESDPTVHHILYNPEAYNFRGEFKGSFAENKEPEWLIQVCGWNTKNWEDFLKLRKEHPASFHAWYKEDGNDITPGHFVRGEEWCYPVWVLEKLIESGDITNPRFINQIEKRKQEEGSGKTSIEIKQEESLSELQAKKDLIERKILEATNALSDNKPKAKVKAKV